MFEEYSDVLTVEEACEALRIGYNAIYDLGAASSRATAMAASGGFRRNRSSSISSKMQD